MTTHRNGAARARTPAQAEDAALQLDRDAANDAQADASPEHPTLEALRARFGVAHPTVTRVAFLGYDPEVGIAAGQAVATERILKTVPSFAHTADRVWQGLSADQRARAVGFVHGMLAVLTAETEALRVLNDRYDRTAKVATRTRVRCESAASTAVRDGRTGRDEAWRAIKRFVTPAEQKKTALGVAADGSETSAALALSCESLADWMSHWLDGMSDEERAVFAAMGLRESMAAGLRVHATTIRNTQADLDALCDENRVTQRQLDAQDGRVLHLVEIIHGAFRAASKSDPEIMRPVLGALRRVFDRPAGRKRAPAAPPVNPDPAKPE